MDAIDIENWELEVAWLENIPFAVEQMRFAVFAEIAFFRAYDQGGVKDEIAFAFGDASDKGAIF